MIDDLNVTDSTSIRLIPVPSKGKKNNAKRTSELPEHPPQRARDPKEALRNGVEAFRDGFNPLVTLKLALSMRVGLKR